MTRSAATAAAPDSGGDGSPPDARAATCSPRRCSRPTDAELLQTGMQDQKHARIVVDDRLRRTPLRDRQAADLNDLQASPTATGH
jgi:hypothetical protein